jgi:hypothetical protein
MKKFKQYVNENFGKEIFTYTIDGMEKNFTIGKSTRASVLKEGEPYFYKTKNNKPSFMIFTGFSDAEQKYGESGPVFKDLKSLMKKYGAKKVEELEDLDSSREGAEYGMHPYMCGIFYDDKTGKGDEGCYLYLYKKKWSLGSSADAIRFFEAEEV